MHILESAEKKKKSTTLLVLRVSNLEPSIHTNGQSVLGDMVPKWTVLSLHTSATTPITELDPSTATEGEELTRFFSLVPAGSTKTGVNNVTGILGSLGILSQKEGSSTSMGHGCHCSF